MPKVCLAKYKVMGCATSHCMSGERPRLPGERERYRRGAEQEVPAVQCATEKAVSPGVASRHSAVYRRGSGAPLRR